MTSRFCGPNTRSRAPRLACHLSLTTCTRPIKDLSVLVLSHKFFVPFVAFPTFSFFCDHDHPTRKKPLRGTPCPMRPRRSRCRHLSSGSWWVATLEFFFMATELIRHCRHRRHLWTSCRDQHDGLCQLRPNRHWLALKVRATVESSRGHSANALNRQRSRAYIIADQAVCSASRCSDVPP